MERRGQAIDRHGRTWVGAVVQKTDADAEDFRFWFDGMTPEERVRAVGDCLLSSLKAQGIDAVPRLRRISRVVERPRR